MTTCYRYRDMKGALAADVLLTVKDAGQTYTARSDANGVVKFAETFSAAAVAYPVGFGTAIRIACETPPPPPPTDGGINDTGRVGTSCSILGQGTNGNFYYAIYHDRKGYLTSFHKMDWGDARDQANNKPECFEAPPPPPATLPEVNERVTLIEKTVNMIGAKVDDIYNKITNIVMGIRDLTERILDLEYMILNIDDKITQSISGLKDTVINWIIESFIYILEKVMEREVRK